MLNTLNLTLNTNPLISLMLQLTPVYDSVGTQSSTLISLGDLVKEPLERLDIIAYRI